MINDGQYQVRIVRNQCRPGHLQPSQQGPGLTKPVILLALNISFQLASGASVSNIFISVKTKFNKLLAFEWSPINLHVDTY